MQNTVMARKEGKVSSRILFTWFMLAGFIFLFAPKKLTNEFQSAFDHIFSWPLIKIGWNIPLSAPAQQSLTDVVSSREHNKLREEYNRLQNHLVNIIEQRDQAYEEIKKLSGLRKRFPLEGASLVSAYVIRIPNNKSTELRINRGEEDGLAEGRFVLGDNGIIGTISYVSTHTARVMLITDPASQIGVKIAELNKVMKGNGENSAKVLMVPKKYKIKAGQNVFAFKEPGFLDAPMIVGKVSQCKTDDNDPLLWDITVSPVCNLESLNDVTVIVMNH